MQEKIKKEKSNVLRYPIMRYLLFVCALLIIFAQSIFVIYQQRDTFFSRNYHAQYQALKKSYESSQYMQKKNPVVIPDEAFESYAAGAFIKGLNPILIVHDHPPLGRYLLGIGIIIFDNVNIPILFFLAASVIGMFLIARMIIHNIFLSLIPVGLFVNEPLFIHKLVYMPLPEPVQLPFIIYAIYCFMKAITSKNYNGWFIATAIMLGFVISTRFFVTGAFLTVSMLVFMVFERTSYRKVFTFLTSLPLTIVVLLLSYFRVFQSGYSLIKVLGIQKYILAYHKSVLTAPFSFWDLLLFNRWHTWWGNRAILHDTEWTIIWPITVTIICCYLLLALGKRVKLEKLSILLLLWLCIYSLALSVGYSSTRYFLPIVPFLYILSCYFIMQIGVLLRQRKQN